MSGKKILVSLVGLFLVGVIVFVGIIVVFSKDLPKLITLEDYQPLLVSEVFDRNQDKIGEFFRERRKLTPVDKIPKIVKQAFIAAEDASFYDHSGVNPVAILRAFLANLKAGRKVQGGSTITQQVAKTIILNDGRRNYSRKIKEAILAFKMEQTLKKEEILYLYLNQIYFGHGAYGIAVASETYFRKPLEEITVPEAALLAGLPKAPTKYTPVYKPKSAKIRQTYVLRRMAEEGFISKKVSEEAINQELKVYTKIEYQKKAPYFLETLRQTLNKHLGEKAVLDEGLKIYTGLDIEKQISAQAQVRKGLEDLDKRQGYRGPLTQITDMEKISEFLLKNRDQLINEYSPLKIIRADGTIYDKEPLNLTGKNKEGEYLPNLPPYIEVGDTVKAIVTNVSDSQGVVTVRFAESKGMIDFETMKWARKPNPKVSLKWGEIKKPSAALKKGDVILARIVNKVFERDRFKDAIKKAKEQSSWPENIPNYPRHAEVVLEQEPIAQGALLSLDNKTGDILAMVGGYDFSKSEYNCSIQASRQSGSSFKAFVYASALDRGYTPTTMLVDAPLVFTEKDSSFEDGVKKWKPENYTHKFKGDILFRNALAQSLNIPTVKVIQDLGVPWVADYAKRLGIFSTLNMDYTLALGSSGVTLYEVTKAFAHFARLGRRMEPMLLREVLNAKGELVLDKLSLDDRFSEEINAVETEMEERRQKSLAGKSATSNDEVDPNAEESQKRITPKLFFKDSDQLIKPTTAYLTTSLLKAATGEPSSTGLRASNLGRPLAGKTGTTNGAFDAWFVGYTPQITTGVWSGYLTEQSLGAGEGGGKTSLPIWLEYMKVAHKDLPKEDFPVPAGITFVNIDNTTGKIVTEASEETVLQAFATGTEPTESENLPTEEDTKNFYKDDLADE